VVGARWKITGAASIDALPAEGNGLANMQQRLAEWAASAGWTRRRAGLPVEFKMPLAHPIRRETVVAAVAARRSRLAPMHPEP
jgi:hypothetical protein